MYGKDLRKKIIDSFEKSGLNKIQISVKFEVCRSFVTSVIKDYKEL